MTKVGITERGDAAIHFDQWASQLDKVDGAILITKDPRVLLQKLDSFDHKRCIIHCTITGLGGTVLEPGVPKSKEAILAYKELVGIKGPESVVLRVDPVIPGKRGTGIAADMLSHACGRVRVSFLDMYKHVYSRLKENHGELYEYLLWEYRSAVHAPLKVRRASLKRLDEATDHTLEICGEPGMQCTGCISQRDFTALGLALPQKISTSGQRKACACLSVKTELLKQRGQCKHRCLYCYWR